MTPTHKAIVEANLDLIATLPNVEADDIKTLCRTCWACGIECNDKMVRAHVRARAHGGSSDPDNFFLLCEVCHCDQPDGMPRLPQIIWLQDREDWVTRTTRVVEDFLNDLDGTRDEINLYLEWKGGDALVQLVHEGYAIAAGWKNGRANWQCLFTQDFREWQKKVEEETDKILAHLDPPDH